MEKKEGFVLHHINANEFDNREENLIFVKKEIHQSIHDWMNTEFES